MMARHLRGKKQIVSLSLDAELVRRVENLADARGMSRSKLIEEFIGNGIDQEEISVKAFQNPLIVETLMRSFAQPEVLKALMKSMGQDLPPEKLMQFHQGLQLVGNYGKEFGKTQSSDEAAERTAEKFKKSKKERRS